MVSIHQKLSFHLNLPVLVYWSGFSIDKDFGIRELRGLTGAIVRWGSGLNATVLFKVTDNSLIVVVLFLKFGYLFLKLYNSAFLISDSVSGLGSGSE